MRCLSICLLLAAFAAHCAPNVEQIFNAGILAGCQQLVYCENAALAGNALLAPWLEAIPVIHDLDKLPTILKAAYAIIEKNADAGFSTVKRTQFCADWSTCVTDPKQGWKNIKYLLVYELNVPFHRKKPAP